MLTDLSPFLLHWTITAFALWVASHVFKGLRFGRTGALAMSALLMGAFVLGGSPEFTIQTQPAPGQVWL